MNERFNQFGPGDQSKRIEGWSPSLEKYEEEIKKIAKIEKQIIQIKKFIEKIGKRVPIRIEMEKNLLWLENEIRITQDIADLELEKHEILIENLKYQNYNKTGNA